MKKINHLVAVAIALSANAAFAGGTVAPAPVEAPAAPAPAPAPTPAPIVVAPAPAPVVVAPAFIPSWYVGLGIGQSKIKDISATDFSSANGSFSVDDKDTSYKIFAGYRFHPNFAVELGYTDLGKGTADANLAVGADNATPGSAHAGVKARAVTLDAVGILPFANNFEVFGKVGAYYAHTTADLSAVNFPVLGTGSESVSDNNGGFHYGVGVGYNFNRNWGVRAEWERFNKVGDNNTTGESDVDNTSISVVYKF